ncbi:MAG TPA: T9SS type A sorting domain-containing protein [Candidatus Kapabacteria bacterium]|jgi:hypothetical protein|nr:T9SS type A sorting domain-containing protein [Candidatus Kapabacteria bacterium]
MSARVVIFASVLLFGVSFASEKLEAQGSLGWPEWLDVGNEFPVATVTSFYFFDPAHGIAAIDNGSFTLVYYLTKIGNWRLSIKPNVVSVRAIRLIQGKLYAATEQDLLVSTDSGQSWQYSGLGLTNANDVYANASGKIRILRDPMKTFARLDTLHCIAMGSGSIFVSSDGGDTWNSIVTGIDPVSSGAFADRCQNVYLCPNSWGTAFRSTDLGQTWRTVITGSGPYSDFLYGASTTAYITDPAGLYRTTDDGLTWKSIITVDSGPHLLFVFGPMGEHVVASWVGMKSNGDDTLSICMTTTGGDDMLHSGVNMTDSNGAPLMQNDTFNVPFELMTTCNAFSIPIPFWSDVDSMTEHMSIANDSLGDFAIVGDSSILLPRGRDETFWLRYNPHHPVSNVVLRFDNHWHCSDWSETRTIHVVSVPTAQILPPPTFTASCQPDTEFALLQLDSCQSLIIDSVAIPPSISSRLHFNVPLPDTAIAGSHDSLFFSFNGSDTVATFSDSVEIFGHYLGLDSTLDDYWYFPHSWGVDTNYSLFYKIIPVKMLAMSGDKQLAVSQNSLDFGAIYSCQSRDTTIWLKNTGCDTLTITSTSFDNKSYGSYTSYPITIPPGDSAKEEILFTPDTTGHPLSIAGNFTITSDANSGPPTVTIPITTSIIYPVQLRLALATNDDSAKDGDTVTFYLLLGGGENVRSTSLRALQFDLTHDDDMLSLVSATGAGLSHFRLPGTAGSTRRDSFAVSPIPSSDTLGTLSFQVYLTKDSTTPLTLSNITFDNTSGLSPDCIASVGDSGGAFTYIYSCGDRTLQHFMQTGSPFSIESIVPNPARVSFRVEGNGQRVEAELDDILGGNILLPALYALPFTLDVKSIPSGVYYLRLSQGGFVQTRKVVIER